MSRRIFEQTDVATPPDNNYRFAFGRSGQPSRNMSITNFLTWLNTAIPFLKPANNLSDVSNAAFSRSNLGVYSTAQVNTLLSAKADIYPASGGALKSNNTTSFTPSADYHPSTKKYVDDNANDLLYKGTFSIGNHPGGVKEDTITFPSVGTSSYIVVGSIYDQRASTGGQSGCLVFQTANHTSTSFKLISIELASETQNALFQFRIYPQ